MVAETKVMQTGGGGGWLWGNPEGKRQLGRPTYRCEKIIKMDSQRIGEDSVDCIDLVQYRDKWQAAVSRVRKRGVPRNVGNRSIS